MSVTVTAFADAPDRGWALARDMPVRWALEEVGQPHVVRRLTFAGIKEAAHYERHPFGQIPTYEEDGLTLFESGAIVLHIAEHHAGLLPREEALRARTIAWMFAALATVEPPVVEWSMARLFERDRSWYEERRAMLEQRVTARLADLSRRLGDADWLEGAFGAGDLLMICVLRRLAGSGLLEPSPALVAYIARGEARPAFRRAFDAQRSTPSARPITGL